jgi:hypothetical protein
MQPVHPQSHSTEQNAINIPVEQYRTGYGCLMLTALTILCCMIFIAAIVLFGPEVTTPT